MSDKSDRDLVLARRRLLMVSALASIAATQTQCDNPFRPCLSIARPVSDAAPPHPCLSAPLTPADAAWVSRPDATSAGSGGADAGPPTPPKPCLAIAPPKEGQ